MITLQEKDKAYVANTYNRFPVDIVSGKGSLCYDESEKRYIDMGSGIGVTSFGIADDTWAAAVTAQLNKVQHMSNLYYTEPCAELARLVCEKTGMKKVFFGNSGAEANECAIKTARKWGMMNKGPEYYNIITLNNSFHGRTITTLAATGQDHYHELFQPLTPGFLYCDAEDLAQMEKLITENKVCAVMMECIQGEGGVKVLSEGFIKGAEALCRKYNVLLIIDEVQTGNGRTGKLYAYMNYGVHPDLVSTAKGIGGGLPLGACLMSERTENILGFGDHGSTFGGNPVSCAGAVSIMSRMSDEFLEEVVRKGKLLRKEFENAPGIKAVSGMGLMVGILTEAPAGEVVKECIKRGVLCLTAKEKVRLLPALNIPDDVLLEAADIIKAVAADLA